MEELTLPKFNLRAGTVSSRMSPDEYVKWVEINWQQLRQDGQLNALCDAPDRGPVNVRFSLR
jgi:hypothetical protein